MAFLKGRFSGVNFCKNISAAQFPPPPPPPPYSQPPSAPPEWGGGRGAKHIVRSFTYGNTFFSSEEEIVMYIRYLFRRIWHPERCNVNSSLTDVSPMTKFSWILRPLDKASLGQSVPWTKRPLDIMSRTKPSINWVWVTLWWIRLG